MGLLPLFENNRKRRRPVEAKRKICSTNSATSANSAWCLTLLFLALHSEGETVSAFSSVRGGGTNAYQTSQHSQRCPELRLAAPPPAAIGDDIITQEEEATSVTSKTKGLRSVIEAEEEEGTWTSDASFFMSLFQEKQQEIKVKVKEEQSLRDPQDFRSDIPLTTTTTAASADTQQELPPWLKRYFSSNDSSLVEFPTSELQELQESMLQNGFHPEEVQEVLETMAFYYSRSASSSNSNANDNDTAAPLLHGMMDFVRLILAENNHYEAAGAALQEEDSNKESSHNIHHDVFASKDVVLAGIIHFNECIVARQEGIYDWFATSRTKASPKLLSSTSSSSSTTSTFQKEQKSYDGDKKRKKKEQAGFLNETTGGKLSTAVVGSITTTTSATSQTQDNDRFPPFVSTNVKNIAASAAAIKRAEILANTILGVGNTRRLTKDEAEGLRGLLLSSMEEWRALSIRCVASLFRLEGILAQQHQKLQDGDTCSNNPYVFQPLLPGLRSPEVVHTAQEAILVYGTLAQRLGMHQLKAKIEERAFRILYQRQYRAVSSVYQQSGQAMHAIRSYLSQNVQDLLHSDPSLMANVEHLQVSSRVKEPFSFWKKLLKTKAKQLPASSNRGGKGNLSMTQVQDGIALRVILKAKKASPDEPEETTRAREKLLCYYVQHLIRQQWPAIIIDDKEDRVKDYIQYPKPNGYQSLHYTASLTYQKEEFPFEVQVRSEEMHRIAEYGVAAHWDYKLASTSSSSTPLQSDFNQGKKVDGTGYNRMLAIEPSVVRSDADKSVQTLAAYPALSLEDVDVILDTFAMPDSDEAVSTPEEIEVSPSLQKSDAPLANDQLEYIDALVTARQSLLQERVYVFVAGAAPLTLEQGQLVILDSGSCICDALAYMEENVTEFLHPVSAGTATKGSEEREPRVWRNGRLARADDNIRNGDVILIELT